MVCKFHPIEDPILVICLGFALTQIAIALPKVIAKHQSSHCNVIDDSGQVSEKALAQLFRLKRGAYVDVAWIASLGRVYCRMPDSSPPIFHYGYRVRNQPGLLVFIRGNWETKKLDDVYLLPQE